MRLRLRHDHRRRAIILGLVLALSLLTVGRTFAIDVDDHLTTADPLENSGCQTPAAKTSFRAADPSVYLWAHVVDAEEGDTLEWLWFAPDQSNYTSAEYVFTFSGEGCAWARLDIAGQPAASLPGQWRVDLYLNDNLVGSNNFTITGGTNPLPPPAAGAAHLALTANDQILVPWGYADLGYRIESFQSGLPVDLYLALQLRTGGPACTSSELVFGSGLPAFAADLALADTQGAINAGFLPTNVGRLGMTIYGVLVARGTSPASSANWVSNLASLDLAMGPLSSRQLEVLATRGNPDAYAVQFFHDTKQRVETWLYEGGGLGQSFQFVNGRSLFTGGEDERASATVGSSATFYDPGRFEPGTSPAAIRRMLGDPDRVVTHPSGGRAWVYKESGITVTVKNGVVRQIEAH